MTGVYTRVSMEAGDNALRCKVLESWRLQRGIQDSESAMTPPRGRLLARRTPNKRSGAAMVEIVTALFIVTFGIFSVLTMYHVGIAKTRAIREHDLVMNALQNELDGLRAMPCECLPRDWNGDFRATKPNLPDFVNLRPHLRIQPSGEGRADLLEVTVGIRWSGEHGRLIEKSLTTLIAEKPVREM